MRIGIILMTVVITGYPYIAGEPSSDVPQPWSDELVLMAKELPRKLERDLSSALNDQRQLYSVLDGVITGRLSRGDDLQAINAQLSGFASQLTGNREPRFTLYSAALTPAVYIGVFQVDLNGPAAFRIYDETERGYARVFASENSLSLFTVTYFALDLVLATAGEGSVAFATVSMGTDSEARRSMVLWVYSRAQRETSKRMTLLRKPGLQYRYDEAQRLLFVSYCEEPTARRPGGCEERINLWYQVGTDFHVTERPVEGVPDQRE
jgi:hypothetical protein